MIFNLVGGGGASLNFSVNTYLPDDALPESGSDNDIAVVTSEPMTSWVFSPIAPVNPENGTVWFGSRNVSSYQFNALKDNGIVICLDVVKQFINGEWVQITAYIYQNGTWSKFSMEVTITENDLFRGQDNTEVTGGWKFELWGYGSSAAKPTQTFDSNSMIISMTCVSGQTGAGCYATVKAIDLTNVKELIIKYDATINGGSTASNFALCCGTNTQYWPSSSNIATLIEATSSSVTLADQEKTLNVSSLSGVHYIGLQAFCNTAQAAGVTMTLTIKQLSMVPA